MAIGTILRRFESLPSTNDTAREFLRAGAVHGTVIVANEQTCGRGTKGRAWHSPAGRGLYASFILRWEDPREFDAPFSLLPLAVGLASAEAILDSAGVEVRLKWPNDLVSNRKKLGGILTESVFRPGQPGHAVVGIGINVNHEEADFPGELAEIATSLRLVTGRPAERESLLAYLCQSLDSWYNSLIHEGRERIIRSYEERMAFSPGNPVRVGTAKGEIAGFYRGLAPDGRLRLDGTGGPAAFSFEEIRALDWD